MNPDRDAEGGRTLEASYTYDGAMHRKATLELVRIADPSLLPFGIALVVSLGLMVAAETLRLPAAVVFGWAVAYFAGLGRELVSAGSMPTTNQTVSFGTQGFQASSPQVEASYHWAAVSRIELTRSFVFLVIHQRRMTLPKTALSLDAISLIVAEAQKAGAHVHGQTGGRCR